MVFNVIEINLSGNIVCKNNVQLTLDEIYFSITELDKSYSNKLASHLDLKQYAIKLYNRAYFIVCRDDDSLIVGIIAYYINIEQNLVYVPQVCVHINRRQQGVATKMLKTLICSVEDSFKTIALEVTKTNTSAISLYGKFGFKEIEDRGMKLYMVRQSIRGH